MGLCKCEKKKATHLFCFEHQVSVCDHCIIKDHSKCIIQSYLQWLRDSDYNPVCHLCKRTLQSENSSEECVRLLCYDIVHWTCLDNWAKFLPETTAPAGFECPVCAFPIIPQQNAAGPIVEALVRRLSNAGWAPPGGRLMQKSSSSLSSNVAASRSAVKATHINERTIDKSTAEKEADLRDFNVLNEDGEIQSQFQTQNHTQTLSQHSTSTSSTSPHRDKDAEITQDPPTPQYHVALSMPNSGSRMAEETYEGGVGNRDTAGNDANNNKKKKIRHTPANEEESEARNGGEVRAGDDGKKYARKPLFEHLKRLSRIYLPGPTLLKGRRISPPSSFNRLLVYLLCCVLLLASCILVFSRLGSWNTENDPNFDPHFNPNIRIAAPPQQNAN